MPGNLSPQALKPQVLLVEDDAVSASALRAILQHRGFNVVLAASVSDGIAQLDKSPAIVILDLMLPDGTGVDILRQMGHGSDRPRVVVTTAANDPILLDDVRQLEPDLILQKPIDIKSLLAAILPVN